MKVGRYCEKFGRQSQPASALIGDFRKHKILVIGDYILDRYLFCDAIGVAGEGPMMALRHLQSKDFPDGGSAAGHRPAPRPDSGAKAFAADQTWRDDAESNQIQSYA